MLTILASATIAFLLAATATPAAAAIARRIGLVVAPSGDRWHSRATPLLGGAAIAVAVLPLLAALVPQNAQGAAILVGAAAAFALGLADDVRRFAPTTKLAGQALLASLLVIGGVRVELVDVAPISFLLTVFWVVALMNAVNLMDNMDGLAAGIAVIAGVYLTLTAGLTSPVAAAIAATTAGAAFGFLLHNFHPARVFMGDAGSQLIGFLFAVATLLHTSAAAANLALALVGPLAVLALPLFDTVFVAMARRIAGRPIGQGGRDHTSHRLAALGVPDRTAVVILYGVAAVLGLLGAFAEEVGGAMLPLGALGLVSLVLFGIFLHDVDVYGARHVRARSPVLRAVSVYGRFGAEIGLDVVILTAAYYLAYSIRFEGVPEGSWLPLFSSSVPMVVGTQLGAMVVSGAYRTLWRYLSIGDAATIVRAISIGTALAAIAVLLFYRFEGYSRAVFVFDWILATALVVASRSSLVWLRHVFEHRDHSGSRRVLIVGADESGLMALRLLTRSPGRAHRVIGFIDDDPGKRHRRIAGFPILGTAVDMPGVIARESIDLVVGSSREHAGLDVRAICIEAGAEWKELMLPV